MSAAAAEADLRPVTGLLPRVRERIAAAAAAAEWPELEREVEAHLGGGPLPLPLVLPLAACAAVGGSPAAAVPAAAAGGLLALAARWLDDTFDRDRPGELWSRVGVARATNLAVGALALATRVASDVRTAPPGVAACVAEGALRMAAGQALDLAGAATPEGCLRLARLKTGAGFALLARSGALSARAAPGAVEACGAYGEHLGMLLQALDDLDGAFHPDGAGDLALGKVTLPVVYALTLDHPLRAELRALVAAGQVAARRERVREILEASGARDFLVWAALEERRQAVESLARLPVPVSRAQRAGRLALEWLADAPFGDLDALADAGAPAAAAVP